MAEHAKVFAVAIQKGGAGKTTTSTNLAVAIARVTGKSVLVVDMDSQANLTKSLGVDRRSLAHTVNHLLFGEVEAGQVIVKTSWGIDLVPADINLSAAEKQLLGDPIDPNGRLRDALESVRDHYAYIVIDCPPALGVLTLNALTAADEVVIPFEANALGTEGIAEILNTVGRVQKRLNPGLRVAGILANRFDGRAALGRDVLEATRAYFTAKNIRVFDTVIRDTVSLEEAPGHGRPAAFYASRSRNHRLAVSAYDDLARELLGIEEKGEVV